MCIQNIHSLPEGRLPSPQSDDTSHHDGVDRMMRNVWFSCQSCPGSFLHCVCSYSSSHMFFSCHLQAYFKTCFIFPTLIFINDSRVCATQHTGRAAVLSAAPPHLYKLPQCLIHLFLVANKYLRLSWSVALVETVLFSYCVYFLEADSWNRTLQACQAWSLGDKCGSKASS